MTYRVRFEAYALVQLHGLPSEAFDAWTQHIPSVVADGLARIGGQRKPILAAAHRWEETAGISAHENTSA